MKRTELDLILGSRGTLTDRITEVAADYAVFGVDLPGQKDSNAVLFDIPSGTSTEFEEIVGPINLSILTLHGIGRVLLHDRASGLSSQHRLAVAECPVPINHGQVYAYQSLRDLVLLDTCTPAFRPEYEVEPDADTLPAALKEAHFGGYAAVLAR